MTESSDLIVGEALRQLQDTYGEEFRFTLGSKGTRVHLFLVKGGLWSLAWTFIPKHFEEEGLGVGLSQAARLVLHWLNNPGSTEFQRLDHSVRGARLRLEKKLRGGSL